MIAPTLVDSVKKAADKAWDELTDKVLPALGPEGAVGSAGVKTAGAGLLAVKLGKAGEDAVRATYAIGNRGFFRAGLRMRFPEGNITWTVEGSTLTSATCDRASVPPGAKAIRSYGARNQVRAHAGRGGRYRHHVFPGR